MPEMYYWFFSPKYLSHCWAQQKKMLYKRLLFIPWKCIYIEWNEFSLSLWKKHPLPLPPSNLFWIFTPDKISFLNIIFTLPVDWVPADYKRNFFIIVGSWIKNSESRIRKFAFSLSQYFALKNWCKTTKVTWLIQQVPCVHFQ